MKLQVLRLANDPCEAVSARPETALELGTVSVIETGRPPKRAPGPLHDRPGARRNHGERQKWLLGVFYFHAPSFSGQRNGSAA